MKFYTVHCLYITGFEQVEIDFPHVSTNFFFSTFCIFPGTATVYCPLVLHSTQEGDNHRVFLPTLSLCGLPFCFDNISGLKLES